MLLYATILSSNWPWIAIGIPEISSCCPSSVLSTSIVSVAYTIKPKHGEKRERERERERGRGGGERERERESQRQTDRQIGRQAGRQADRQTDRETGRQAGRDRSIYRDTQTLCQNDITTLSLALVL